MKWCPITLRSDLDNKYTTSGIYIAQADAEFCLTISSDLGALLGFNGRRGLCALDADLDRVVWENVELVSAERLEDINADLRKYTREFKIIPNAETELLVLRFLNAESAALRRQLARHELLAVPPKPLSPVMVTSSPFGGAHSSLFHGYLTTGTVSLVRPNLVFVDGRYLEGMEGGCASVPSLGSIGLVAGTIVKSNGEGRLLLVVPWKKIVPFVPQLALPTLKAIAPSAEPTQHQQHPVGGVVAIQMKIRPNIVSWGSGVLVAPTVVVTNSHVVHDYAPEKIETRVGETVRFAKIVHRPFKNLDLVALELVDAFPAAFAPVKLAANDPLPGSRVHAVGYGLFSPERYGASPQPLQSDGIVSKSVKGMLMSTASCWNGSSGGALLNDAEELVGVMASNAKDNSADEIMPDIAMSIPISVVKLVLGKLSTAAHQSEEDAVTDDQFQKLWKMDRTHKDVAQPHGGSKL